MSKHNHKKRALQAIPEVRVGDEEKTRILAYEFYVQRGMEDGHELEDWLRAEEELSRPKAAAAAA